MGLGFASAAIGTLRSSERCFHGSHHRILTRGHFLRQEPPHPAGALLLPARQRHLAGPPDVRILISPPGTIKLDSDLPIITQKISIAGALNGNTPTVA